MPGSIALVRRNLPAGVHGFRPRSVDGAADYILSKMEGDPPYSYLELKTIPGKNGKRYGPYLYIRERVGSVLTSRCVGKSAKNQQYDLEDLLLAHNTLQATNFGHMGSRLGMSTTEQAKAFNARAKAAGQTWQALRPLLHMATEDAIQKMFPTQKEGEDLRYQLTSPAMKM